MSQSAKRQRTSYSPASPPYHIAAKPSETKTLIVQPNPPPSPPYPSMNSQSNGGFSSSAIGPPSVMTPPASVVMSQQYSPSGLTAGNPPTTFTPASTAGPSNSMHIDSDGDAMMLDTQDSDAAIRLGGRRRTDHNRQPRNIFAPDGGVAAAKGICGSQLFLGCQSSKPSRPHASQDLFELYKLGPLARSVARTNPVTGEKTNKLRKSYEGQIKKMQIAGKHKAVKMDGKFTGLMSLPEEEYYATVVSDKDVSKVGLNSQGTGLNTSLGDLVNRALGGIGPGGLSHSEMIKHRQYIGTDDTAKPKPNLEPTPHRATPSASGTPNTHTPISRISRPERTGSKRQYTDGSYSGYGEGYADDFADSTGGEDNAQGNFAKRRKMGLEQRSRQVEVGGVRR
ncbi:Rox3-domain-containing protein [Periconia macrospinosa]|uniref:Mediator of RNA polymerase II transcription subunit 19 n=1 Tax=Periconia macrospinosa TaxID=97972 RepID=A0A2V1EDB9_9PLEO|nr:Rox3-domain-containing protein [Periconia macrospinosa]